MKKLLSKLESSGVAEADSYSNLDAESLKIILGRYRVSYTDALVEELVAWK